MKYIWIVMLIIGEILWIKATIKELKENKEALEDFYQEKFTFWENFCDCFCEIKSTFFFVVTHIITIFVLSLALYVAK
jgi:hypothetical protein